MIKVLVIDDHPEQVRTQWAEAKLDNLAILLPMDEVVSFDEAMEQVIYYQPDVVLLDWYIGSTTGGEVLVEIEKEFPEILVLGNSSITGKFEGIVNIDKDGGKLFDALIPLIKTEKE